MVPIFLILIRIRISLPFAIFAQTDSIFVGQMSNLNASDFIEYTYIWSLETTLSVYDIPDSEARPRQNTTYYLNVTNQYYTHNDSVTVFI